MKRISCRGRLCLYVYTVQPRDTLTAIAAKAFVPLERLRAANSGISPNALQAGAKITIPSISNYIAGTLSFYVLRNPDLDRELINDYAPYSSSISIFEYHIAPNGDIANQLNDAAAIETTWQRRVTNLTSGGFSTEIVHQVLNNPTARTNLVNNIYDLVSRRGYGGVTIDFEQVSAADRDFSLGFYAS